MSNTTTELSISNESQAFELVQRQAKLLSTSTLVPKEFQGNMANCAIGLNIAKRLGADSFMVLQNIDVIHGRPSFRATFLIAMVNASGRFSPLQFRMSGEGQSRACVAHCKVLSSGETVEGPEINMAMAKAEGWSSKNGSKWLTMPELMLRYRAAAFFARIYAPDITLGMQTSEEVEDVREVRNVTPRADVPDSNPYEAKAEVTVEAPAAKAEKPAPKKKPAAKAEAAAVVVEAETVEDESKEKIPPRPDLVAAVRAGWRAASLSQQQAEAKYREAGILKHDSFSKTSDAELYEIVKAIPEILPPVPEDTGADLMEEEGADQ